MRIFKRILLFLILSGFSWYIIAPALVGSFLGETRLTEFLNYRKNIDLTRELIYDVLPPLRWFLVAVSYFIASYFTPSSSKKEKLKKSDEIYKEFKESEKNLKP